MVVVLEVVDVLVLVDVLVWVVDVLVEVTGQITETFSKFLELSNWFTYAELLLHVGGPPLIFTISERSHSNPQQSIKL